MLKTVLIILSLGSLLLIIVSATMVFLGNMTPSDFKTWTIVASLVWFVTSPWWMISRKTSQTN
ncbi:MAG TPA: hypothetical protein ENH29_08930 [Bacteroidetes bacterium]|nr:hypothetical protein [Bacteroidota bacterium]